MYLRENERQRERRLSNPRFISQIMRRFPALAGRQACHRVAGTPAWGIPGCLAGRHVCKKLNSDAGNRMNSGTRMWPMRVFSVIVSTSCPWWYPSQFTPSQAEHWLHYQSINGLTTAAQPLWEGKTGARCLAFSLPLQHQRLLTLQIHTCISQFLTILSLPPSFLSLFHSFSFSPPSLSLSLSPPLHIFNPFTLQHLCW